MTGFVVVHPQFQSPKWRLFRVLAFVATGLTAFAPIIHGVSIFPYQQLDQQTGLRYNILKDLSSWSESCFTRCVAWWDGLRRDHANWWQTNFPESWKPGRFDIWGSSHQVFHISVVIGAAIHLYGILVAFQWNYENQRCKTS